MYNKLKTYILLITLILFLPTLRVAHAYDLPDTGQCQSYTDTVGEDSDYTINPISYTDNGDGTITDNVSGQIWQQEDDGEVRDWSSASSYCDDLSLGGFYDWRLPSVTELVNIVDYGEDSPSINTDNFPDTDSSSYWTSYTSVENTLEKLTVSFKSGGIESESRYDDYLARCVRGEEQTDQSFTDNGDGTVTDNLSGLMWQEEDDSETHSWTGSIGYCEGLALADHSDWRLPNIKELVSIVDYDRKRPSIDEDYFPNTSNYYYWSSTTDNIYTDDAWIVYFVNGENASYDTYDDKSGDSNYVRCVRGGVIEETETCGDAEGETILIKAELTSPIFGLLTSATATFEWTSGTNVSEYTLTIGSSALSHDIYNGLIQDTSVTVSGLPSDGSTLYVTLWSKIDSIWYYAEYTYIAAGTQGGITNDPIPSIMANDTEGALNINEGDQLSIAISLDPGSYIGTSADWYIVVNTSSGWISFNVSQMDYSTSNLSPLLQDFGLISLGSTEIFSTSSLSAGTYTYYFAVNLNGQLYFDSVLVTIGSATSNTDGYDLLEYFPLAQGNWWIYDFKHENESDWLLQNKTVIEDYETINNVSSIKIAYYSSDYENMNEIDYYELYTFDSEYIYENGFNQVGNPIWNEYQQGLHVFDPALKFKRFMNVGDSSTYSTTVTRPDGSTYSYSETVTLVGIEDVSVKAGSFSNCIKLELVTSDRDIEYMWWAKNIGEVKLREYESDEDVWEVSELNSYYISSGTLSDVLSTDTDGKLTVTSDFGDVLDLTVTNNSGSPISDISVSSASDSNGITVFLFDDKLRYLPYIHSTGETVSVNPSEDSIKATNANRNKSFDEEVKLFDYDDEIRLTWNDLAYDNIRSRILELPKQESIWTEWYENTGAHAVEISSGTNSNISLALLIGGYSTLGGAIIGTAVAYGTKELLDLFGQTNYTKFKVFASSTYNKDNLILTPYHDSSDRGLIIGKVYEIDAFSGVLDVDQKIGIGGVKVELKLNGALVKETETLANGMYLFEDVEPRDYLYYDLDNTYVIEASKQGYSIGPAYTGAKKDAVVWIDIELAKDDEPCGSKQVSGNDEPDNRVVELDRSSGTFQFDYETYYQEDRITIAYEGNTLFDTGCVGASGTEFISYSGYSTSVTVSVTPNCNGGSNTAWNYTIHCPE